MKGLVAQFLDSKFCLSAIINEPNKKTSLPMQNTSTARESHAATLHELRERGSGTTSFVHGIYAAWQKTQNSKESSRLMFGTLFLHNVFFPGVPLLIFPAHFDIVTVVAKEHKGLSIGNLRHNASL